MLFPDPLQEAVLLRRYKRFLADIELPDGSQMTLHCPNTGSMKNCQQPGSRVWFSLSDNPKRKYPGTWQVIEVRSGSGEDAGGSEAECALVGINTGLANRLVAEAIDSDLVAELRNFTTMRREVAYGKQRSRIDLLLQSDSGASDCFVEVKNVSLGMAERVGLFPDAVTSRGQKHLQELIDVAQGGQRAVLFFCVQHTGIDVVRPADEIDPDYGRLLREAAAAGVELLAYRARFDLANSQVSLDTRLPVQV